MRILLVGSVDDPSPIVKRVNLVCRSSRDTISMLFLKASLEQRQVFRNIMSARWHLGHRFSELNGQKQTKQKLTIFQARKGEKKEWWNKTENMKSFQGRGHRRTNPCSPHTKEHGHHRLSPCSRTVLPAASSRSINSAQCAWFIALRPVCQWRTFKAQFS